MTTNLEFDVTGTGSYSLNLFYQRTWEMDSKVAANESLIPFVTKVIAVFASSVDSSSTKLLAQSTLLVGLISTALMF